MVSPGTYTATLTKTLNGITTLLDKPVTFNVVKLRNGTLPGSTEEERLAFFNDHNQMVNKVERLEIDLTQTKKEVKQAQEALIRSAAPSSYLVSEFKLLNELIENLNISFEGNPSKNLPGEKNNPNIWTRLWAGYNSAYNTYGPTETAKESLRIAVNDYLKMKSDYQKIEMNFDLIKQKLKAIGAPYFDGQF